MSSGGSPAGTVRVELATALRAIVSVSALFLSRVVLWACSSWGHKTFTVHLSDPEKKL